MSDIVARWLCGYRGLQNIVKRVAHRLFQEYIVPSPLQEDFTNPDIIELLKANSEHKVPGPDNFKKNENWLFSIDGRLWVPDEAHELQWKLFVTAHCTYAGLRSIDPTRSLLRKGSIWPYLDANIKAFVSDCIHYVRLKFGTKIPRPQALIFLAIIPNRVVHIDYLYMGPSLSFHQYSFVPKDDQWSYVWLTPYDAAVGYTAAMEISRWICIFTATHV